jgi:hypothetical protein
MHVGQAQGPVTPARIDTTERGGIGDGLVNIAHDRGEFVHMA